MKNTTTLIRCCAILAATAILLTTPAAFAADASWTNNASSVWTAITNWTPNAAPGATSGSTSTDTATFGSVITNNRTITVDANRNVSNIVASHNSFTYTLATGPLVVSGGGSIRITGATNLTISAPILLGGNCTLGHNGTGGIFSPSGNIGGLSNVGPITLTLDTSNTGTTANNLSSGIISNGVGNVLSILKTGTGNRWQVNGVNTFTGGVIIQEGSFAPGGALAAGPHPTITLGNGSTVSAALLELGSVTVTNGLLVSAGAGTRTLNFIGGGGGNFNGPITLNNDLTIGNGSAVVAVRTVSGGVTGTGNVALRPTTTSPLLISGVSMNPSGSITNVGVGTGNVTNSAVIGANVASIAQNSANSFWILTAANTYAGSTYVNVGQLMLVGSGAIDNSTNIVVASGATFNVGGVIGGYSLKSGQSLLGSGTVSGAAGTAGTAKIYAGTDGSVSTLSFDNNLNTSGGGSFNLDVSTSAGGGNDAVSVAGTLTPGATFRLRALSGAAPLDTTTDYVLITAGSVAGSFGSTPTWIGTAPANAASFTITTNATQVLLHFNPTVPPTVTASASPNSGYRSSTTKITAVVTPGSGAITSVTADVSSIGGSPTASLVLSNANVYTNTFTVGAGSSVGSQNISVLVTDANALTGSGSTPYTVLAAYETWNGAGANDDWGTGANWTNGVSPSSGDFIFFAGSTRTTPNLEAGYSAAGVTFNSGAASFAVGTANASMLTLTGGVTNNSANAQALNVPILLGSAQARFNTSAGNLTLGGAVDDAGLLYGVTPIGTNTLTLSAAITYSGPTIVNEGTLALTSSGTLGNSGTLTVNGGTLNLGTTTNTISTLTVNGGTIANGTLNVSTFAVQAGVISASLDSSVQLVKVAGATTLTLSGVNNLTGGVRINDGLLNINNAGALGTGSLTLNGAGANNGGIDNTSGNHITIANDIPLIIGNSFAFGGSSSLNLGTGPVNIGSAIKTITVTSNTLTIGGVITNSAGTNTLTKAGAGTLILSGASTYAGATIVTGGTLLVNGSIGTNVASVVGGRLGGTGTIGGSAIVQPAGTLAPGASIGTLNIAGDLTLNGNVAVEVNKSVSPSNDLCVVTGAVTYGGTLTPTNIGVGSLVLGDAFQIFSSGSQSGNFTSISGTPGPNLAWSFNPASGVLSVVNGIATNPTNITFSVSGGNTLNLSWPASHLGWILQTQSNGLNTGISTNWSDVAGTTAVTSTNMTINPASPTVFFRLRLP